jgi:membrane fusion protein, multidrug efflux system
MRHTQSASRLLILALFTLVNFTVSAIAQEPPPAKVVVEKMVAAVLAPTSPMIGVLDFDKKSGISSEISGLIQNQEVSEGQLVKKGDILVRLNTDFLEKDIEILVKQVAQIEVKIQNARKNVLRYEKLFKRNATSEKAYEDIVDNLNELMLEQEVVRKRIERKELEVTKSRIRAPFNGLVLEKQKNEGEWLATGAPVCTVASTDDVMVRVAVPEGLIRYVHAGQKISLSIGALEKNLQGTVDRIVPVADMTSKTVQVKIAIPYSKHFIQNMSTTVHIPVNDKMKLKMVRRDALVRNQGKVFIYTVEAQKAKILPVTIAAYEGEMVGLTDPFLKVGMPVVIDGNERLRPGQAVMIVDAQKASSSKP